MPEHRIRFRGGWEWVQPDAANERPRWLTLPLEWPRGLEGPFRLVRYFQRPRCDPLRDALFLSLEQIEGLGAVWLNERELARPDAGVTSLFLPLLSESLASRNALVLEVSPPPRTLPDPVPSPWGAIALVIRPVDGGPIGG